MCCLFLGVVVNAHACLIDWGEIIGKNYVWDFESIDSKLSVRGGTGDGHTGSSVTLHARMAKLRILTDHD